MANIMRTPSFFFDTNYAVLTDGEYSENAVKLSKETSQYIKDYIDRYTKTNQLVKAPVLYQVSSTTLDTYYGMIYNEFGKLIQSLNNSNISVDEALEQYRRNVKSYQIDEILKEANQNIGKEYKSQQ